MNKSQGSPTKQPQPAKEVKLSARQLVVHELFQTEKNYVGILQTIKVRNGPYPTVAKLLQRVDCGIAFADI